MARERKSNKKAEIVLAILVIILVVLIGIIIVLSVIWSDKSPDNTKDNMSNESTEVETTKQPDFQEQDNVVKTYTAVFEVADDSNKSQIEKAMDIIYKRMTLFGMQGEVYDSDNKIVVNVALTELVQEQFLKYIATPGEFSIISEEGQSVLKPSMIEMCETDIETLDTDDVAGRLIVKIKDESKEDFKKTTESIVGKTVNIMLDGVTLRFFKWSNPIESGTLILSCFNSEELIALGVVLKTDIIPVKLRAVSSQKNEME